VLSSLGAEELSYREMSQKAELHTGGLSSNFHLVRDHSGNSFTEFELTRIDRKSHHASLYVASHCLDYNMDTMFSLWSKLLTNPKWDDKDHIKTLLLSVSVYL
jgi:Zn-dependent M16 (insulinase) family peptidase